MVKVTLSIACLMVLLGMAAAGLAGYGGGIGGGYGGDVYAYPQYTYKYGVQSPHTGDVKNQWESRDGGVVKGGYSLVEPDGNVRVVEYVSGPHSGFNAVVKNLRHSVHPAGGHHYG